MGRERPPDKLAPVLRVLSALLGLTAGFIAGQLYAPSLTLEQKPAGRPDVAALPPAGAPVEDRVLATPRMNEDALTGVLAAVQDAWVKGGSSVRGAPHTERHLRQLFSRWTDLDAPGALRAVVQLRDRSLTELAVAALMAEWGLRDPLGASQNLTVIPAAAAREHAALALARSSVQRNPADGLALVKNLIAGAPPVLRSLAGAEWMRRDAGQALRYLLEEPGMAGTVPAGAALGLWLMEDPAAWLKWMRTSQPAGGLPRLRFPAGSLTAGRLARMATVLARELPAPQSSAAWLTAVAGPFAAPVLAAFDPASVLTGEGKSWQAALPALPPAETIPGWLARAGHARCLASVLPLLGAADAAAALRLLTDSGLEDGAPFAGALAAQWMEQAPASASSQLFAGDLSHPAAKAAAAAAVDALINSDPLSALDGLKKLPLEKAEMDALRAAAFGQLAATKPAAMLAWLAAHPDAPAPPELAALAVRNLAATDAARAGDWIRKSAPPGQRAQLAGMVFAVQLLLDRDAALESLTGMPAGEERDAILTALADADTALSRRDRFFAGNLLPGSFVLALGITADAARLAVLGRILTTMKETGVPATASLAHPALRPADRAALNR